MTDRRHVILLVDDNITNLKVAIEHLEIYHFDILTARSGEAGLARADAAQPDLILLDVQMPPGIDGFETCRRLKANPRTADIPVIFMTALAETEDKVHSFEVGAVDYLTKPIDAAELLARVHTHLQMRALQTQLQHLNAELTTLVAQLEQRNEAMSLLSTLGELLQTCHTSAEAYTAMQRYMPRLLPASCGSLFLLAASCDLYEAVMTWGDVPPAAACFAPEDCWALRRGRTHVVHDIAVDVPCQHLTGLHPSALCVPMMAEGQTMGLLHVRGGPAVSREAQQFAETIASHLALALANLHLREALRQQAIRDALTGLFNRRYLEETLEREVHRATRSQTPLSIIMLDIDHFKRFNDVHGHEAGDAVLQALGTCLQANVRHDDIPCRYGGEEFTLILPNASLEIATRRAETLRGKVESLNITWAGHALGPLTLSLGVAAFPQHGATGQSVLQAADAALYRAKHAGRNRVVVA